MKRAFLNLSCKQLGVTEENELPLPMVMQGRGRGDGVFTGPFSGKLNLDSLSTSGGMESGG